MWVGSDEEIELFPEVAFYDFYNLFACVSHRLFNVRYNWWHYLLEFFHILSDHQNVQNLF